MNFFCPVCVIGMDVQPITGRFGSVLEQTNETLPILGDNFTKTLVVDRERETVKVNFGSFVNTVVRVQGCDSLMIVSPNQEIRSSNNEEEKDTIEGVYESNLGRMRDVDDLTEHLLRHHPDYIGDMEMLTDNAADRLKALIKEATKLFMKRMLVKQLRQERAGESSLNQVFQSSVESVRLTFKLLKRIISLANFEYLNESMEKAINNIVIWEMTMENLLDKEEYCGRCIRKNQIFCFH